MENRWRYSGVADLWPFTFAAYFNTMCARTVYYPSFRAAPISNRNADWGSGFDGAGFNVSTNTV